MVKVASGTRIGPFHVSKGLPNQDAFNVHFSDRDNFPGLTVLAVADGAGSLERSDEGAQLAVSEFPLFIEELYETSETFESLEELEKVVAKAFEKIIEVVHERNDREIGSTLIVFVCDDKRWVCGSVGDSFAVLKNSDGSFELLKSESTAEFANQTVLLTSDRIKVSLFSGEMSEISGVALTSDGLENSTITKKTSEPVSGFWNVVFSKNEESLLKVSELLEFMDSKGRLEDDTTLVVASFGDDVS